MKTPLLLALSVELLIGPTACVPDSTAPAKNSQTHAETSSSTTTSVPTRPADPGGASGDFCTQLRNLIRWQLANADQIDAPPFLTETASRYGDLASVAPAEYREAMTYFAKYAAEPPAQAAQEPGFADQAMKVTEAATHCHVDLGNP
jgi:hypothetical protein